MTCHVEQQLVGRDGVGGEREHQQLACVGRDVLELDALALVGLCGRVGAEADVPYHAAHVAARRARLQLAALGHALEPCRDGGREVGVGVALEQGAQGAVELLRLFVGDVGKSLEEHELGHEFAHRIALRHVGVDAVHAPVVVVHICLVGLLVQAVLLLVHLAQVVDVCRVAQGHGLLRLGELAEHQAAVAVGHSGVARAHVHEVEVEVCVEAEDVVGVVGEQTVELRLRGGVVVHLVLEDDAHVVQALLDDVVGGGLLLVRQGDLLEVVFGVVRVVGALAALLLLGRLGGLGGAFAAGVGGRPVLLAVLARRVKVGGVEARLVAAAPVVLELARAPAALELGAAGRAGALVVEVPRVVVVHLELLGSLRGVALARAVGGLFGHICLAGGLLGLLALACLEVVDGGVDDVHSGRRVHRGQLQQRVLVGDVLRVGGQLVQDVRAPLQRVQAGIVFRQLGHGLGVAGLGLLVAAFVVEKAAEADVEDGLVDAVAGRFGRTLLVVLDGLGGVAAAEVEVADGVVNLVEVLLVAVVARHASQGLHLAGDVGAAEHLALADAGVELRAVGCRRGRGGASEGLVSLLLVAGALVYLAQEEGQTRFLCCRPVACRRLEEGCGLGVLLLADVQHRPVKVVEVLQVFVGEVLLFYAYENLLGLVKPVHGQVGAGLPQLRLGDGGGQPAEVAAGVEEGGAGAEEVAVHVLAAAHHQPVVVQKRVVLLALHPLFVLGVVGLAALAGGLFGDRAQLDGLLRLLYRAGEVAVGLRRLLVALGLGGVGEHQTGVVVLVALLHLVQRLAVVFVAVVVDVVFGDEGRVLARHGGVALARVAARERRTQQRSQHQYHKRVFTEGLRQRGRG